MSTRPVSTPPTRLARAQAAIFDGILFLLITALAVSMIFVFVNKYGGEQDSALRSAHMLNYVQSAVKELYYVRVETLSRVADDEYRDKTGQLVYSNASAAGVRNHPYFGLGGDNGCKYLDNFKGPITVTDLVKRDLADGSFDNRATNTRLAGQPGVIEPGKLALRCAMKEIMKPFTNGGLRYFVEFTGQAIDADTGLKAPNTYPTTRGLQPPDVDQNAFTDGAAIDTSVVTDSSLAVGNTVNGAYVYGKPAYRSCQDITAANAANPAAQQDQNFVVAVPFRVVDTSNPTTTASTTTTYTLQVCIFNAV